MYNIEPVLKLTAYAVFLSQSVDAFQLPCTVARHYKFETEGNKFYYSNRIW